MTEEEAGERACPMAMPVVRPSQFGGYPCCLGSRCMAWVWEPREEGREREGFCGMMPQYPGYDEEESDD